MKKRGVGSDFVCGAPGKGGTPIFWGGWKETQDETRF